MIRVTRRSGRPEIVRPRAGVPNVDGANRPRPGTPNVQNARPGAPNVNEPRLEAPNADGPRPGPPNADDNNRPGAAAPNNAVGSNGENVNANDTPNRNEAQSNSNSNRSAPGEEKSFSQRIDELQPGALADLIAQQLADTDGDSHTAFNSMISQVSPLRKGKVLNALRYAYHVTGGNPEAPISEILGQLIDRQVAIMLASTQVPPQSPATTTLLTQTTISADAIRGQTQILGRSQELERPQLPPQREQRFAEVIMRRTPDSLEPYNRDQDLFAWLDKLTDKIDTYRWTTDEVYDSLPKLFPGDLQGMITFLAEDFRKDRKPWAIALQELRKALNISDEVEFHRKRIKTFSSADWSSSYVTSKKVRRIYRDLAEAKARRTGTTPQDGDPEEMISKFFEIMPSSVRADVVRSGAKTWEDIVANAARSEEALRHLTPPPSIAAIETPVATDDQGAVNAVKKQDPTIFNACGVCGVRGHFVSRCPLAYCNKCRAKGHWPSNCHMDDQHCTRCGSAHGTEQCRKRVERSPPVRMCWNCNGQDHIAKYCPQTRPTVTPNARPREPTPRAPAFPVPRPQLQPRPPPVRPARSIRPTARPRPTPATPVFRP